MMDPSPHLENRRRPRPGCYPEQSPRTETKENGKCAICAKLPLRLRPLGQSLLFHSLECIDIDFGLFEIVNRRELEEDYELGADVANRTADNARRHAKCYRKLLSSAGLLREGQNFSGQATCARVVAPFSRSEVKKGRLLGSGGFSSVYEIESFQPDEVLSAGVTQVEEVSRQFLTEHPMRQCEANKKHSRPAIPRYAVKHLRHSLTRDPERFERAAIDLVLEGQLLLAMDHPHIISIRGWSYEGPDAYRSGKYSDYFLILDRLAETAEIRIEKWRSSLRKYRSRQAFPWCRKKYETKIQNLLRDRINTARCVASAIEYMHDRRVIHRDVKTANLGFDVHNEVKIFDFGLSRMLPDESEKDENGAYSMSRVGTRIYMAPEVRHKQPYNLSADVYSFGVVLWELLSLSTATDSMIRARSALERYDSGGDWLPICPCWPLVIQDTIRQCLSDDPADRPCIGEVCMVLRDVLTCLNHGGKDVEAQRRRSTLRLDLSTVKEKESLDSRTSHVSSSHFESEEL